MKKTAKSAFSLVVINILKSALRFLQSIFTAAYFGTGWMYECYIAAITIPQLIITLFDGALYASFIPTFKEIRKKQGAPQAWGAAGTIFVWAVFGSLVISLSLYLVAPKLLRLCFPGFSPSYLALTQSFFNWLLLTIVIFVGVSCLWQLFHVYDHFAIPSLLEKVVPLISILSMILLAQSIGVYSLVGGRVIGYGVLLILFYAFYVKVIKKVPAARPANFSFISLTKKTLPLSLSSKVSHSNILIDRFFASFLKAGSMVSLHYSTVLIMIFREILVLPLALPFTHKSTLENFSRPGAQIPHK